MADETNNSGQVSNDNSGQQPQSNQVDDRGGTVDGVDPTISKHLDMAIEAQDGKVDVKTKEASTDESKNKEPVDSKSSTGDTATQSGEKKVDAEVSEAARKLAGAKDLTLPDGTKVKGGAERRFYEQREAARQELGAVKSDYAKASQQLQQLQEKYTALENSTKTLHGADPQTLTVGAKIVSDMQRDPVGTIKKLVAEAAAQGYNVNDLGVGVDTAAIKRLIEERFPQQETVKSEADLTNEAQAEVNQFYSQFPDAKPHDALLAAVLRDHPELDMRSAYFAIKSSFAEKGFDWSLSLEDNLKTASGDGNGGNQQQTNQTDKKPLPTGGNGSGGDFKLNDKSVADDSMDTGDIVKQAMRESGLNI